MAPVAGTSHSSLGPETSGFVATQRAPAGFCVCLCLEELRGCQGRGVGPFDRDIESNPAQTVLQDSRQVRRIVRQDQERAVTVAESLNELARSGDDRAAQYEDSIHVREHTLARLTHQQSFVVDRAIITTRGHVTNLRERYVSASCSISPVTVQRCRDSSAQANPAQSRTARTLDVLQTSPWTRQPTCQCVR